MFASREKGRLKLIPSMGGFEIGESLREYASECHPGESIVELGVWLGAGTAHIIAGAKQGVEIHAYDRFTANDNEVRKAAGYGVELMVGQNTIPVVKELLGSDADRATFLRGPVAHIKTWHKNKKIGLYVDDVCKRYNNFVHAIEIFSPAWRPGTIIVLMDYHWHKKHLKERNALIQPRFMDLNRNVFKFIRDWDGLCCRAYRYLGGEIIIPGP